MAAYRGFMIVARRLTAKNRDQLQLGCRVWATITFLHYTGVCLSMQHGVLCCTVPDRWLFIHATHAQSQGSQPDPKLRLLARFWCFAGGESTFAFIIHPLLLYV